MSTTIINQTIPPTVLHWRKKRHFLNRGTSSVRLVVSFASRPIPSAKQHFVSLSAQFRSLGEYEDSALNIPTAPCDLSLCSACGTLELFTHANSTQMFSLPGSS